MDLYTYALFAHVSAVLGIFAGMGVWTFSLGGIRRARRVESVRLLTTLVSVSSNLVVGSIAVLGVAGFYMAITVWGAEATWIIVATINFLLLAPLGLLLIEPRVRAIAKEANAAPDGPVSEALAVRTHDPLLATGLNVYIASLIGIVFVMTVKPAVSEAILAAVSSVALGIVASLPLWYAHTRKRAVKREQSLS